MSARACSVADVIATIETQEPVPGIVLVCDEHGGDWLVRARPWERACALTEKRFAGRDVRDRNSMDDEWVGPALVYESLCAHTDGCAPGASAASAREAWRKLRRSHPALRAWALEGRSRVWRDLEIEASGKERVA